MGRAALCLLMLLLIAGCSDTPAEPEGFTHRYRPEPLPTYIDLEPGEGVRTEMGQLVQTQEPHTSGPSPESLRFRFTQPGQILGVSISVDIDGPELVEHVIGINVPHPYGISEDHQDGEPFEGDGWLLHVSDANGGQPSKIDEQLMLPHPVDMEAGDYISVDAWIGNQLPVPAGASPEVIVFYRYQP